MKYTFNRPTLVNDEQYFFHNGKYALDYIIKLESYADDILYIVEKFNLNKEDILKFDQHTIKLDDDDQKPVKVDVQAKKKNIIKYMIKLVKKL